MTDCPAERDFWPDPPDTAPLEDLEISPMRMDQVDEILVMENESFPTPWTREGFDYDLTQNPLGHYWVLESTDGIIGYAGIWLVGNIAHITTICIREDMRGIGLGRWFILSIMAMAAELGARRFTLEVREQNFPALNLYKSIGFREVGRRVNYYQEIGEDALVMWTGDPPYET